MIKTKEDLSLYIKMDMQAMGRKHAMPRFLLDYVWKFMYALRHEEYYTNRPRKTLWVKCKKKFWKTIRQRYGYMLGFSISPNCFGPGLRINHYGYIVVNPAARIGEFCDIHQGVNIGQNTSDPACVPTIGNNVWIGPGAKIFGKITLADEIQVGANAVVNRSFLEKDITVAGIPARKIREGGTLYKRKYE